MNHRAVLICSASALGLVLGCAGKESFPSPKPPVAETTSAPATPSRPTTNPDANPASGMNISDEIRKMCGIVDSVERAPKFDYDSSALSPQEKDVLGQVARCLTEGPLKGRSVQLVGRADRRGEQEYNMQLGEHRGNTVEHYLTGLGVERAKLSVTSRGELDATGHDDEGWRKDRRVDISLMK